MGEVYRARDPRLQRNVALKVLHGVNGYDPHARTRLLEEARAAGALNHPNILVVYDVGAEGDTPFIVSELVDGESLREVLSREPLGLTRLLDLAAQVADGLAAAHDAGIIHRDLKPENVMVTPAGRVKILDFGIAKALSSGLMSTASSTRQAETATGVIQGTVPYMSPEQARGGGVDFRTDQFALGAVLYEMATGTRAFSRDTPVQTLTAIIEDDPRPIGELNPRVPVPYRWIVDRCLAKDPSQRYASTADLAHDLHTLRDRRAEVGGTGGPIAALPIRPSRRVWMDIAAVSMAVAVLAAGGTLFWPPAAPNPRFTPLASDSTYQGMPAWSPDGKTVAYVGDAGGVRQIFTRSLSSSRPAQITKGPFDCRDPFWARDGSRIYYVSRAGEADGVYSVSAAGGPREPVMPDAETASLAPDGRTLAFLRSDEGGTLIQLWLSSLPSGEPRRYMGQPFANQKLSDGFLRYSPDGSKLAAWVRTWELGVPGPSLWVIPTGEGSPYTVANVPQVFASNNPPRFDWLADNRHLVAAAVRTGIQGVHLWLVDTETGEMVPLTTGAGGENAPAVSADGQRIAYATEDANFDLIEVPVDGSAARPLLATSRNETEPAWSPTGSEYVFVSDRNGRPEIWLRSRDGTWEKSLVTGDNFSGEATHTFRMPAFSPDGQKIAFERVTNSGAAIWIATLAGGPPVQVTQGAQDWFVTTYSPTWSPDGEWIAYVEGHPDKWSLAKVRAGTRSPAELLHEVTGLAHPQWSPDNRWIACDTAEGLSLVAPDGKSIKVIAPGETWIVYGWSSDATTLYGVRQSDDLQRLTLVSVDVASGRERVVRNALAPMPPVNAPIRGFSRISDKSFATSLVRVRSDLWLIDDFVPRPNAFKRLKALFWR